jgi:hypothetical protein
MILRLSTLLLLRELAVAKVAIRRLLLLPLFTSLLAHILSALLSYSSITPSLLEMLSLFQLLKPPPDLLVSL